MWVRLDTATRLRLNKIHASIEMEAKIKLLQQRKQFQQTVSKEQFREDILKMQAERSKDTDHG